MSNTLKTDNAALLAKEFASRIPNGHFHNIYVIQTEDKNGNITDTKFGKNLMTDYGLENCRNYGIGNIYLYFGEGSTPPSFDDISLEYPWVAPTTRGTMSIANYANRTADEKKLFVNYNTGQIYLYNSKTEKYDL